MDQTPAFHPLDYVSVVRRRIWWLVVPIALAVVVGLALTMYLPREYRSTATLGISLPEMGGQVVSDSQRLSPHERTRNINQVLLSPTVLERVAQDEAADSQTPLDAAIQRIAAGVDVRLPPDGGSGGSVEVIYVDYAAAAPDVAQRVANRLAEVFVEESSRKRTVRAEQTSDFIASQLQQSEDRLQEVEARLTAAKESFMGSLPEQTSSNLSMVESLGRQLDSTVIQLQSEQDRLSMIESKLESYRPPAAPDGEPSAPTTAPTPPDPQVAELERRLTGLLTKYTDAHAEVRSVRRELETAKAQVAATSITPGTRRAPTAAVDQTYERLVEDELRSQQRIAELQRTVETTRQQTAELRGRVDSAPRVQQQIAGLVREYELEKDLFAELTSRMHDAQMAENVERGQGGEQFTIIARAALPQSPSSPNVPRLMIVTVLLGICLGGALALGREYFDRSIHDARTLSDLDVPVLGEIPRISQV
jgi:polysaccharide chain length determinant protein (PEP-CTERM system associated)